MSPVYDTTGKIESKAKQKRSVLHPCPEVLRRAATCYSSIRQLLTGLFNFSLVSVIYEVFIMIILKVIGYIAFLLQTFIISFGSHARTCNRTNT